MRKVIQGYAKDKNLNLILIGTIPVPYSKDKRTPVARQDKRYTYSLVASYKRAARADCAAGAAWWPPAMEQRHSSLQRRMSAFGTKRTSRHAQPMSAFGGKAER